MIRSQNKGGNRLTIADFIMPLLWALNPVCGLCTLSMGTQRLLFFSGHLSLGYQSAWPQALAPSTAFFILTFSTPCEGVPTLKLLEG